MSQLKYRQEEDHSSIHLAIRPQLHLNLTMRKRMICLVGSNVMKIL
jgi:hypothetical protein